MTKRQYVITGLIVFFVACAVVSYFSSIKYVGSLFLLTSIFIVPSLALTAISQMLFRTDLKPLPFIAVAVAVSVFVVPLLNLIPMLVLGQDVKFVPIVVTILILVTYVLVKRKNKNVIILPFLITDVLRTVRKNYWVLFVLFVYGSVIGFVVLAYYPLPDLDPYYWMNKSSSCFDVKQISSCLNERPIFESLVWLFTDVAHVDRYAFFKYVFPCISLAILPFAILVAKTRKVIAERLVISFLPLSVPSTLLYLLTPMPQALAIIAVFIFFYSLAYSQLLVSKYFYYFGGAVAFLSYGFHEAGALFLIVWLVVTVYSERRQIKKSIKRNKPATFFALLFILSCYEYFISVYRFVFFWAIRFFHETKFRFNFSFPSHYLNVDGNSMGWPGLGGVIKYYSFYVGPLLLALFFLTSILCISGKFSIKNKIINNKFNLIFALVFFITFTISEIFPRVFGFAFLPERVWIFAGIASLSFIFLLPDVIIKRRSVWVIALVFSFVGIAGGIYVNAQKKYLIPSSRLIAAEWIKSNLPDDRIILSSGDGNLLKTHAQSFYINMPPNFYCDTSIKDANSVWAMFKENKVSYIASPEEVEADFAAELKELMSPSAGVKISLIHDIADLYMRKMSMFSGRNISREDLTSSGYIYFFKEDGQNPYAERPYFQDRLVCRGSIFQNYPESFRLVYDKGDVKIWKITK